MYSKRIEQKKILFDLKKSLLVAGITFINLPLSSGSIETVTSSNNYISTLEVDEREKQKKELTNIVTLQHERKEYYDCLCPHDLQEHIFKLSLKYGVPSKIVMSIIERESGGNWNTNGVISKTNDYGLAQINICNLELIEEDLGYTKDEILNDPYKNVEAAFYLLRVIIEKSTVDGRIDYENVFGMYNGWVNWRDIPSSVEYSNACMEILENKYSEVRTVYIKKIRLN